MTTATWRFMSLRIMIISQFKIRQHKGSKSHYEFLLLRLSTLRWCSFKDRFFLNSCCGSYSSGTSLKNLIGDCKVKKKVHDRASFLLTQGKYSRVRNRRRAGNKRRALNKHRAWTKCAKLCYKKPVKLENICRPWKKFQNLINVGSLIRL